MIVGLLLASLAIVQAARDLPFTKIVTSEYKASWGTFGDELEVEVRPIDFCVSSHHLTTWQIVASVGWAGFGISPVCASWRRCALSRLVVFVLLARVCCRFRF